MSFFSLWGTPLPNMKVSSSNSKPGLSLRDAFMNIASSIELNPQYPYIPLVIGVRVVINQRLIAETVQNCAVLAETAPPKPLGEVHDYSRFGALMPSFDVSPSGRGGISGRRASMN